MDTKELYLKNKKGIVLIAFWWDKAKLNNRAELLYEISPIFLPKQKSFIGQQQYFLEQGQKEACSFGKRRVFFGKKTCVFCPPPVMPSDT